MGSEKKSEGVSTTTIVVCVVIALVVVGGIVYAATRKGKATPGSPSVATGAVLTA